MEISRLVSSILGTKDTADSKPLELKVGQVVRGIVLQLFADQEALVNIAGTTVRAKLETPLLLGQSTMLQVQPESAGGQVILRPLADSGIPITEQSLADLTKSLGMKDTDASRTILRELHLAGIPLNTKNVNSVQAAIEGTMKLNPSAELKSLVDTAVIAFRKDLPMRSEILSPLHQTLFGKPISALTNELTQALQTYIQQSEQGAGASASSLQLAQKLSEALLKWTQMQQQIPAGSAQAAASPDAKTGQTPAGANVPAAPQSAANQLVGSSSATPSQIQASAQQVQLMTADSAGQAANKQPVNNNLQQQAIATSDAGAKLAAPTVNQTSDQAARTISAASENAGQAAAQSRLEPASNVNANPAAVLNQSKGQSNEQPSQFDRSSSPHPQQTRDEPWIKSLFKHLGIDYERKAFETFSQASASDEAFETSKETVKGLILQLNADDKLPPALKEALQQTLQQITGQQLLLGSERGTPISIMTMMVPIGQQGEGTDHAAVQIQARKNKNGRFDSDNCRLIFDLHMSHLGNTLIDVAVVNRIVSLQVHNDHPLADTLLEEVKPDIAVALGEIGYQFISMKHLPYPIGLQQSSESSVGGSAQSTAPLVSSSYRNQPYKGVDMRI
jgi:hypothetical protein